MLTHPPPVAVATVEIGNESVIVGRSVVTANEDSVKVIGSVSVTASEVTVTAEAVKVVDAASRLSTDSLAVAVSVSVTISVSVSVKISVVALSVISGKVAVIVSVGKSVVSGSE